MFMLRETDRSITDICLEVGFTSLGTFSRTFREIVGAEPDRLPSHAAAHRGADCFTMAWMRPSSFGEATSKNGQ